MTRIITMSEIEAHLSIEDCIGALETMFEELGHERAVTNSREDVLTPVRGRPEGGPVYHGLKSMGGSIPALGVGAVRINSDILSWGERGGRVVREKIPAADGRYTGLVLLFSTDTGEPLAIFPDGVVQSYRVGATSALGAKYLARPDASRLGMLGAGWQARAHLLAHASLQSLSSVRVYSPTPESREAFAAEMDDAFDFEVIAVDEPAAAFEGADVVQTATNAIEPVFDAAWLAPGTHVGVISPSEAPDALFAPEDFDAVVQSWSQLTQYEQVGRVVTERVIPTKNVNNYVVEGDEPVPRLTGSAEEPLCDWSTVPGLGDVVVGTAPGRSDPAGITVFFNRGTGLQFAATGAALYEIAEAEDLGRTLPTELLTQEYHP